MDFSVLLPTRNRPELLERALRSALRQTDCLFEVIVIDDGTIEPHVSALETLKKTIMREHGAQVQFHTLPHLPRGHGHGYALNYGASKASGRHLCFLDDDDEWTDPGYLGCGLRIIRESATPVDLLFFNQMAVNRAGNIGRTVWIEDLGPRLAAAGPPDELGAFDVGVAQLMSAHGFCHVNTTIIRRELFDVLGGFDEAIRYEEDRDFYLRAIDRAGLIKFVPRQVAQHNVPDPAARSSFSAQSSELQKRLFQITVLDKAVRRSRHAEIVQHARRHKVYALQRAAYAAYALGEFRQARGLVLEGLRSSFGPKCLAFAALFYSKAAMQMILGRRNRAIL